MRVILTPTRIRVGNFPLHFCFRQLLHDRCACTEHDDASADRVDLLSGWRERAELQRRGCHRNGAKRRSHCRRSVLRWQIFRSFEPSTSCHSWATPQPTFSFRTSPLPNTTQEYFFTTTLKQIVTSCTGATQANSAEANDIYITSVCDTGTEPQFNIQAIVLGASRQTNVGECAKGSSEFVV